MEILDPQFGLHMVVVDRDAAMQLDETWDSVGIYALLGDIDENGHYNVYAGKSPAGLRTRIKQHVAEKRFWWRALLIKRQAHFGFRSDQASWMEGDLWDLFTTAEKAQVINNQTPGDKTLPFYDINLLRKLREPIVRTLRMLGYETESAPEMVEEIGATPQRNQQAPARVRTAYNVSVADLLRAGFLTSGDRLISTSHSWPAHATVNEDGTVSWDGQVFKSLSVAGQAVRDGSSTNGWDFWAVESSNTVTPMSTLRRRYLDAQATQMEPDADLSKVAARDLGVNAPGSSAVRPPECSEDEAKTDVNPLTPKKDSITIRDLVDVGLLRAGDRLRSSNSHYPGEAEIGASGAVVLDGVEYSNPSAPAAKIRNGGATNGWVFWLLNRDGATRSLADLREEYLRSRFSD